MPSQKKEIIYPIFLQCCLFTNNDLFWENVFEDLSYGKTPYGTYISKDALCCNYKSKEFNYKIEAKDPQQMYTDVYNLLTTKLGLLSPRDRLKKKEDFFIMEQEIREGRKKWSNIKKKNVKDLCIERYVIDMKHKYSLSLVQMRRLLSAIFIGMVFKVITSRIFIMKMET